MKRLITILCVLLTAFSASAQNHQLSIASWNIRILSNNSRDDSELRIIADIIDNYDLVAIQEIRDEEVIKRMIHFMKGDWDYCISQPAGRGVKELYAFLFKPEIISKIGLDYLFPDPYDLFIREPYVASFESGNFDFTLITFHAIFGDSISDRRTEIALLPVVIENLRNVSGEEEDIILLGDFNLPPDDSAWNIHSYVSIIPSDRKTTISDTSSYDNIWMNEYSTFREDYISFNGIYHFDELLFDNDDKTASHTVSDHRPVSVLFSTVRDSDGIGQFTVLPSPVEPYDENGNPALPIQSAISPGDLVITKVITTPTEQEAIYIKNITSEPISAGGCYLGDQNDPDSYRFPSGLVFLPGETKVFSHSVLNFIINNSGEKLYLYTSEMNSIDKWP